MVADATGTMQVRLQGQYLAEALRACRGIVDIDLTDSKSPVLFITEGYQLVVMPMLTSESKASKRKRKRKRKRLQSLESKAKDKKWR